MSIQRSGHYLDWTNRPSPFKIYKDIPTVQLPRHFPRPEKDTLQSIKSQSLSDTSLTIQKLSELLFFSAGLTRKVRFGNEKLYMRAASATGALYPNELYVVSSKIEGLEAGLYHFEPLSFTLGRIQQGNYTQSLARSTAQATASSPLSIIITSLAWRNAWKYEERSYRHWFWDAGVIAANLLATCSAEELVSKVVLGFIDSDIDRVLGLHSEQEATVAVIPIGLDRRDDSDESPNIAGLNLSYEPLSSSQEHYPIIWETNTASALHTTTEVESWRRGLKPKSAKTSDDQTTKLQSSQKKTPALGEVILKRGSTRRFAQKPISIETLSNIMIASTADIPLDFLTHDDTLIEFYMIANAVNELPSGSYYFDRDTKSLKQLKAGNMRYISGYLCLEQLLFSDASVIFFLMADLHWVFPGLGDRGYRAAQFEAGVRAGKIYLASYAEGIGASGSTFYDDAVTNFFSPHAKDLSCMIAVGVGLPDYKAKPGKILPQLEFP